MNNFISSIWSASPPDGTWERIQEILHSASDSGRQLQVFFRADDIALVDESFSRLMHLFLRHETPLCLAVVPDWLDRKNWRAMQDFEPERSLWCWHQHGRSHRNHEKYEKKCEFGDSRSREEISKDLDEGRANLTAIIGDLFFPVFTPPWNRCGRTTLKLLQEKGFRAVSRSKSATPSTEGLLPDLAVNVDLHTRKESDSAEGWQNLLTEFAETACSGPMGLMLHHQRMNEAAFSFLDLLLTELSSLQHVSCCTFRELL